MRDIQQVFAGNNPQPNSDLRKNPYQDSRRTDEIDLIEILAFVVRTIKRYRLVVGGALITGVLVGLAVISFYTPGVEKELVCKISNVNHQALSTMLIEFESKIKDAQDGPIKGLRQVQLLEASDVGKEDKPFIIKGKFNPNADVVAIQNSLIQHIENNSFVKSNVEVERESMKRTIEMLKADEQKIAALLNNAEDLESESFSIADMSKLKMDFYKERILLEGKMKSYSAVQVIQNFTGKEPSQAKSIILIFSASIALCFFLAVAFIVIKEVAVAIKRYERRLTIAENGFNVSRTIADQLQQQKKVSSI